MTGITGLVMVRGAQHTRGIAHVPGAHMQRYVLASHTPEEFAAIAALVTQHRPGDGLRAALPLEDALGELTHLYALQGADRQAVDGQHEAMGGQATTLSFDPCDSVDCRRIEEFFLGVKPVQLPPLEFYAFLLIEVAQDEVGTLVPPPTEAHVACAPTDGGRRLLVQVADDDRSVVAAYLNAWEAVPQVRSVRALRSSGRHLVRSPHV